MDDPSVSLTLMHGCGCSAPDVERRLPVGHGLSRARFRHLRESELLIASNADIPVGIAAYKLTESEVRVIHELLLASALPHAAAMRVTDVLLSGLELVALDEGVSCLTFLLRNRVVIEPFDARGYMSMPFGNGGMWLQRKLGWPGWCTPLM